MHAFCVVLFVCNNNFVDPVPSKAYIIGEVNSTKIVELNQPAILRCLAGGHPRPVVNWWKGTEILPLNSERFEVKRDYSLVFNSIQLSDLGPYICQAYSGEGKPVSIYIVLKAIGPITEPENEYSKYIIQAPALPTPPSHHYPSYPVPLPPVIEPVLG